MKRSIILILLAVCLVLLTACGQRDAPLPYSGIEFADGQYYAVAYLGYETMDACKSALKGLTLPW